MSEAGCCPNRLSQAATGQQSLEETEKVRADEFRGPEIVILEPTGTMQNSVQPWNPGNTGSVFV